MSLITSIYDTNHGYRQNLTTIMSYLESLIPISDHPLQFKYRLQNPTTMTDALVLKDVHKSYGNREAVHGISLEVKEGEIFGLLGHNGAGKTTTLRMISTLLRISSGSISVYGHDVATEPEKVREVISYLPEDAGAYKDLTGRAYLEFISKFYTSGDAQREMVSRGIELADLGDRIDSKVDTYSKGMMRRLLIARAIMPSPKLAIMDEVTSGLDVINAYEIREVIRSIARNGVTVIMSSHNMFEVEMLCDRVGMMDQGNLILLGTPDELKERFDAKSLEEVFVKAVMKE